MLLVFSHLGDIAGSVTNLAKENFVANIYNSEYTGQSWNDYKYAMKRKLRNLHLGIPFILYICLDSDSRKTCLMLLSCICSFL